MEKTYILFLQNGKNSVGQLRRKQLPGETQARRHSAHGSAHEMVQIAISGGGQFERAEADILKSK